MILIAILALISVLAPQTPDPMHAVVRPALMSVRCNDTGWEAQIRLTTNLEDSTWNVRQPVKSQWAPRRTQPSDRTFTTTVRAMRGIVLRSYYGVKRLRVHHRLLVHVLGK